MGLDWLSKTSGLGRNHEAKSISLIKDFRMGFGRVHPDGLYLVAHSTFSTFPKCNLRGCYLELRLRDLDSHTIALCGNERPLLLTHMVDRLPEMVVRLCVVDDCQ